MRRLCGGRSQPPRTTGCGERACRWGASPSHAQGSKPGGAPRSGGLVGAVLGRCRSLLPLGGRVCEGILARPYFAARHEVMLHLMRLATHCRDSWVRRLRAPACMRPPLGDRFLMACCPRPLESPPPPYSRTHEAGAFCHESRVLSRRAAAHRCDNHSGCTRAQTPRPVAEELPGVMPPGRTWKE